MNAIDTNVFIYSVSADEPKLQSAAQSLLAKLDPTDTVLLWQVLCEFGSVATKLARKGLLTEDVSTLQRTLRRQYQLIIPSAAVLELSIEIRAHYHVSYWDSLLVAACVDAGVARLYTQDVQSAPVIHGVEITNPFSP